VLTHVRPFHFIERKQTMPNWCDNHLRVTGPNEDVEKFRLQAVGHSPWDTPPEGEKPCVLNFHSLVPVPEAVLKAGYELAGYDWELKNWGCKWGACQADLVDDNGCELVYGFDTAWSPPLAFLEHASKQWPSLTFILEYEESGNAFKGLTKAANGVVEDYCIQL
jgi:hypothetical protein